MLLMKFVIKVQSQNDITEKQIEKYLSLLEDEIDIREGINAIIKRADDKLATDDILITCDEV